MKKHIKYIILLLILYSISLCSYAAQVRILGINATDKVYIRSMSGTNLLDPGTYPLGYIPGGSNIVYTYTANPGTTIRIRKELDTGEYIEKLYDQVAGDENMIYMITLGFFETDRKELDSLVVKTVKRLERTEGKINEVKTWVIKAVKDLQKNP